MRIRVDPLIAESVPDGTFGGARDRSRARGTVTRRWSRAEQDAHYAALAEAVSRRTTPREDA